MKHLLISIIPLLLAGCIGSVGYYDKAADNYDAKAEVARPAQTDKKVRYIINVERTTNDEIVTPVSDVPREFNRRARGVIDDIGVFKHENIGRKIERPDYYFIFNITVRNSGDPGLFSGIIFPFFRNKETIVRLQVLDFAGRPVTDFVGASEQFYARHIFLLPATPFYLPFLAENRAERNAFRAVAVKAMDDAGMFIEQKPEPGKAE